MTALKASPNLDKKPEYYTIGSDLEKLVCLILTDKRFRFNTVQDAKDEFSIENSNYGQPPY